MLQLDNKPTHVHPFVAWTAVVNFALIFVLAPSFSLAQAASPDMSSGSTAVAMRVEHSTFVNHAKKVAEASEPKEGALSAVKKFLSPESPCMRSCRISRNTCGRENSGDVPAMHACYEKFHDCVASCKEESKTRQENLSDAQKTYLAALETARKEKLEAIKEAEADYVAAVKAAQDALKASKEAINASSN